MKYRPSGRKLLNTGGQTEIWTNKMPIKFVDHSFVHNLKISLNIKTKDAKIFTFFQAEVVSSQNSCTRGSLSDKFS